MSSGKKATNQNNKKCLVHLQRYSTTVVICLDHRRAHFVRNTYDVRIGHCLLTTQQSYASTVFVNKLLRHRLFHNFLHLHENSKQTYLYLPHHI